MKHIMAAWQGATTSAAAIARAPTDAIQPTRSATAVGISNVRRRLYESALQAAGRASGADDSEYGQRKASLAATRAQLHALLVACAKHAAALRALGESAAALGGCVHELYGGGDGEHDGDAAAAAAAASVAAALAALRSATEPATGCVGAEGPLQAHLRAIDDLRPAMAERENCKTDVDARERTLRELQQRSGAPGKPAAGGDAAKLARKGAKLAVSRAALADQTAALYARFHLLDACRFAVVTPALNALVAADAARLAAGAAALRGAPPIPLAVPPGAAQSQAQAQAPQHGCYSGGGGGGSLTAAAPMAVAGGGSSSSKAAACPTGGGGSSGWQPLLADSTRSFEPLSTYGYEPSSGTPQPQAGARGAFAGGGGGGSSGGGGGAVMGARVLTAAHARQSGGGPSSSSVAGGASGSGSDRVRVLHAYAPATPDELELRPGDVVTVTCRYDDGWAMGVVASLATGGRRGAFPLNHTAPAQQ